jgi:hypothetical protein
MRNILTLIIIALSVSVFAQKPEITFEKKGQVFKNIQEGETLEFYYKFTNTGDADFKINGVHPTCGCTVAEWPKYAIKPGQSDSIKVTFNTEGRPGYNAKGVNIHSNAGEINLVFEAYVTSKDGKVPE